MSCDPIWTVWCDARGPGCPGWCEETAMRAPDARANAKRLGWRRIAGRDVCPHCVRNGYELPGDTSVTRPVSLDSVDL